MKAYTVKDLVDYIEVIRRMGYDTPIGVSGPEQSGKSTLAMQCVVHKKKIGPNETERLLDFLKKNVIFTPADIGKLNELKEDDDVPVDEAIRVAWRREFYKPQNRWMVKLFRQIGRFRRTYWLNIPKFWSLDDELLSDRVKIWIHIIKKEVKVVDGKIVPVKFHAVIFKKDYHAYQDDPWMKREARRLMKEDRLKRGTIIDLIPPDVMTVVRKYAKLPSFHAYLTFEPLPDALWETYREYSYEKKLAKDQERLEDVSKWQLRFYTMVHNLVKRGATREVISELTTLQGVPLIDQSWISKSWKDIEFVIQNPDDIKVVNGLGHKKKKLKTSARPGRSPPTSKLGF